VTGRIDPTRPDEDFDWDDSDQVTEAAWWAVEHECPADEAAALAALTAVRGMGEEGGPALVRLAAHLYRLIAAAEFPALVAEEVTDDGETFQALRCPVCGSLVQEDELSAVDVSERWTSADIDGFDFEREAVSFCFDGDDDYQDTLYYLHVGHSVQLPDGWKEHAS